MQDFKDETGAQLSGRLMAIEMLLTLILARIKDPSALLDKLDAGLARSETQMRNGMPNEDSNFVIAMHEAAREAADNIRFELGLRK